MVLIQRAHRGSANGIVARGAERALGHRSQGRLVQDRLCGRRQMPPLGQQPRLKGRRPPDGDALEQVRAQTGQADGIGPGASGNDLHVDRGVTGQVQDHGISVDRSVTAQAAADLGQIPAKRPERVVGLGEEQRGKLAPSRRPFAQDQIGQDCPALLAAERVGLPGGAGGSAGEWRES